MKEMNKKNYVSPMVEILNARVEKGFQSSSVNPDEHLSGLEGYTQTQTSSTGDTDMGDFD